MSDFPVITIDGPSGSGKGTISLIIANKLGWDMLDSGALYRLVAFGVEKHGISLQDETKLADYARTLDVRFEQAKGSDELAIYLEGEDVTRGIRTEKAGNAASKVAAIQPVRDALLDRQRAFSQATGLVADGRDMGTTVFPSAGLKIFLTASAEERAKRRHKQLKDKGIDVSLPALVSEIAERDARDSQRAASPLKPAADAIELDTSDMTIDEVVERVTTLHQERFK
ncbi:MAG: (d)CMP kinase [Gammaproteobacteria bacterium]|nr:(d)CMP kinase [Gammaproteobacteria bacterium]